MLNEERDGIGGSTIPQQHLEELCYGEFEFQCYSWKLYFLATDGGRAGSGLRH